MSPGDMINDKRTLRVWFFMNHPLFSVQFYMQASKYLVNLIPPNLNNQCTFDIGTLYYIFEKKVDK